MTCDPCLQQIINFGTSIVGPTGPRGTFGLSAPNFDAFGRLRVSNPFTLFDSSFLYKDNNKFDTYTTGAGQAVFNTNGSLMELSVSTGPHDEVLRQSYRVFPYQPGKSLQIMTTFCMCTGHSNLTQRVGYFNSSNGVFVEQQNSTINLVIRSKVSGTVVEDRVAQSNWNIDALNGSGPSGLVLNISKAQIFVVDLEWLGVGTVRAGFVINGCIIYTHYFNHANLIDTTYMTTATLPVSYQILNTSSTSVGGMMKQICSTVLSEGGYQASSTFNTIGNGLIATTVGIYPTITPLCTIRLKSGRNNAIVLPSELQLLVATSDTVQFYLMSNAHLNSSTYVSYGDNSNVEYNTGASGLTGGTILQQGYCVSSATTKATTSINSPESFNFQLGVSIRGVSDTITLAATSLGSTADVLGFLGWYELN